MIVANNINTEIIFPDYFGKVWTAINNYLISGMTLRCVKPPCRFL